MSDNHIDPDLAVEVFILERPVRTRRSGRRSRWPIRCPSDGRASGGAAAWGARSGACATRPDRAAWERLTEAHARARRVARGRVGVVDQLDGDRRWCRRDSAHDAAVRASGWVDARWLIVRGSAGLLWRDQADPQLSSRASRGRRSFGSGGAKRLRACDRDAGWALRDVIRPGDVVVLHDPQTLGLASDSSGWARR